MARARNIKPGFFSNDDLVELSFETRLLFIGLWTIADRAGRLLDRPKKIKMDIFPGDSVDVEKCLCELAASGFIRRYEALGVRAIQISNWDKHQNPHVKEAPSTIPYQGQSDTSTVQAPDKHQTSTVQEPEIPERAGLIPDSGFLIPDSLNRIPDTGLPSSPPAAKAKPAPKARKPAKSPLPEDFAVSDAVRDWAKAHGHSNLQAHFDYFVGKARANGYVYADWDQALQNAVREDWAKLAPQARGSPPGSYQTANDKAKTLADRLTGKTRNERTPDFIDLNDAPARELG